MLFYTIYPFYGVVRKSLKGAVPLSLSLPAVMLCTTKFFNQLIKQDIIGEPCLPPQARKCHHMSGEDDTRILILENTVLYPLSPVPLAPFICVHAGPLKEDSVYFSCICAKSGNPCSKLCGCNGVCGNPTRKTPG